MNTRTIRRLFATTVAYTTLLLPVYGIASGPTGDRLVTIQGVQQSNLQAVPQQSEHTHDLAVISLKVPKKVTLSSKKPVVLKSVKVAIQNRSPYFETIPDQNTLSSLVSLTVVPESDGSDCSTPVAVLHTGKPQPVLPMTLNPNKKLNVVFDVTFTCAVDPLKGSGHEDFYYIARVDASMLDGQEDVNPASDVCPRSPVPVVDGAPKDKGCGWKLAGKILGGPVLSDVVLKGADTADSPLPDSLSLIASGINFLL